MSLTVNPLIARVESPPIAEAMGWVRPDPRGRPLINLAQAVPSYPPAEDMRSEIGRLAALAETSLYTDILGLPALRDALARHMGHDYRGEVSAENVALTPGCNQAFCAAVMALAGHGDNVILPVPYYFNHHMWLTMLGIEARFIPALGRNTAHPLPRDAAAAIDGRTRAIVLCSPNNPVGSIYPPAVIGSFYDLAKERGIALIIDETYKDFRPDPAPPHDLFTRSGWQDTFVQLFSFSKIFAMTGYRVGSIIAGAPLIAEIEKILDCTAICAPHLSQAAALFGLRHLDEWKATKKTMMLERVAALRKAFATNGLRYRLAGAGAFFAYVEHPFERQMAKEVAMRLASRHGLLCLPGSMFGPGQDNYLRLAFANVEADLMPEVAERLIESQRE